MIEIQDLTKRYGPAVAVNRLSFTVRPGTVTGFLGPNGSGKSTTLRMIIGLDFPDSGQARIGGRAYHKLRWPLREVGALLEARAFHPRGGPRGVVGGWGGPGPSPRGGPPRPPRPARAPRNRIPAARVEEVLATVGLAEVAGRRAGKFSLGMAQRLGIATALLGDPQVLLLDEPVNGLDPEGIRWLRTLLQAQAAQGRTVLVSSHLISEMALTAERLVVIGQGRLLTETTVAALSATASSLEEAFLALTSGVTSYHGTAGRSTPSTGAAQPRRAS